MKNTEFFLQVTVCIQLNLQSDLRAKACGAQPQQQQPKYMFRR